MTLYIFDEPTTGLHFDDINKLLAAFRALIDAGGSLLVIEHNLDVIKTADYVIETSCRAIIKCSADAPRIIQKECLREQLAEINLEGPKRQRREM